MKIKDPDFYIGKKVAVYFYDKTPPIFGICNGYTPDYDDPEDRANIDVEADLSYVLYTDEIERIEAMGNA